MGRDSDKNAKENQTTNNISSLIVRKLNPTLFQRWLDQPDDYTGELFVLSNLSNERAVNRGCLAGAATLLMLRRRQLGGFLSRLVRRKQTYQLDPPPFHKPKSIARKVLRLAFDLNVSAFVGIQVCIYNVDHLLVATSVASIPLVPGRSVIADEFCASIVHELHSCNKEEVDTTTMFMIQSFVRNCELRGAYERKLRKEHGLPDQAPVSIPLPGVPMDYTLKENAFAHGEGDERIGNENDGEWAELLVTDQEEMDKNTGSLKDGIDRK